MKMNFRIIVALALGMGVVGSALADDLRPPPWVRGTPGTTAQEWDFFTPAVPLPPDGNSVPTFNPFGPPALDSAPGSTWLPTFAGRVGVWEVHPGGSLNFRIPNLFNPTFVKDLWLQVTYFGPTPVDSVTVPGLPPFGPGAFIGEIPMGGGWIHRTVSYQIFPQPDLEFVSLMNQSPTGQSICIDQVVIDTRCRPVPEPATFATMGVGLAALVGIRRRRKAS